MSEPTVETAGTGGGRLRDALAVGRFRVLAGAFLVTVLGGSVASLAMTALVYSQTRSALLAACVFSLVFVPYLFAGTLLSALTDRWPGRRLLVACNVVAAGVTAVIALPGMPIAVRLSLLCVVGLVSPISAGASNAMVARALPAAAYVPGRAVLRVIGQGSQIFGAAIGGALLAALSPSGVLTVDALGYAGAALLVAVGLPGEPAPAARAPHHPHPAGMLRDSWSGARAVLAVRPLRAALLLVWAVPFFLVAPEGLAAPYVSQAGLRPSALGWWFMALPLGTVLGSLAAVWTLPPGRRRAWIRPLAMAEMALLAAVGLAPHVALAWVLLVVCGTASAYGLGVDQYVLDVTPRRLLGRMFTLQSTGLMVGQGIGFAAWGAVGEWVPARAVIAAAGGVGLLVVLALPFDRGARRHALVPTAAAGGAADEPVGAFGGR